MDIRRFLIGGNKNTSNTSEKDEIIKKRSPKEESLAKNKTIKGISKYFTATDTPKSSDTEIIPSDSDNEEQTVKKQQVQQESIKKPSIITNIEKPIEKNIKNNENGLKKGSISLTKIEKKPQEEVKKVQKTKIVEIISGPLSGKTYVITGLMREFQRDSLSDLIKEFGGKVTGSVSKRTSVLIHGYKLEDGRDYNLGNKYKKAEELGIKILNEEEIKQILDDCIAQRDLKEEEEQEKFKEEEKKTQKNTKEEYKSIKINPVNCIQNTGSNDTNNSELWIEKFKPKTLKDLIGNTQAIQKLQDWLEDWDSVVLQKNLKQTSPSRNGKIDNINASAVLISGPPGIGKTTAARLVASLYGYRAMEMNASDSRSKKLIMDPLLTSSKSHCLSQNGDIVKNLLIMDEIDGMSSGDRGGSAALIQIIKTTKNPIICICNDRQSPKIKTLANYCYDLKFFKPNKLQITKKMCDILKNEGLSIEPNAVEQIVESSGNDIRQILTTLDMWARTSSTMTYMRAKQSLKTMTKDSVAMLSNFDAATKLFNRREMSRLSHKEKIDLAFVDYELIPLLVQENYLAACDINNLSAMAEAAESISLGDCLGNSIKSSNNWGLLPQFLQMSCLHPTSLCKNIVSFAKFPEWFGKFSTQRKNERLVKELQLALGGVACVGYESILNEYVPILNLLIMKLLDNDEIEETADLMNYFNITPDMLKEHLTCLSSENHLKNISANAKRKLTVIYNNKYKSSIERRKTKRNSEGNKDKFDPEFQEIDEIENEEEEDNEKIEEKIIPEIKKSGKKKKNQ